MISILPHIQYLIRFHDCVVLPGFGALIANQVKARREGDILYAPSRTLGFNPSVCHNDGLLATSVARREGISYAAAVSAVSAAVEEMRRIYDVAGELELPRIGCLHHNADGSMEFEPASINNIAAAGYFGLQPIDLTQYMEEPENILPLHYVSPIRRALRYIASVVVLLCLGTVLSTMVPIERGETNLAAIGVPAVTTPHAIILPDRQMPESRQMYLAIPDREESTAIADAEPAEVEVVEEESAPEHRYYLVVASYETMSQAQRYVERHSDENLSILEGSGRFRVYAATGNSVEEASHLMNDPAFRAVHPDGWVHKR